MMEAGKFLWVLSLVPTTILITISFFVLFAHRKVEDKSLKAFGYVVVALLWIAAATVFATGIYVSSQGCCPMMSMPNQMMQGQRYHHMMNPGMMNPDMMEQQR